MLKVVRVDATCTENGCGSDHVHEIEDAVGAVTGNGVTAVIEKRGLNYTNLYIFSICTTTFISSTIKST